MSTQTVDDGGPRNYFSSLDDMVDMWTYMIVVVMILETLRCARYRFVRVYSDADVDHDPSCVYDGDLAALLLCRLTTATGIAVADNVATMLVQTSWHPDEVVFVVVVAVVTACWKSSQLTPRCVAPMLWNHRI